MAGFVVLRVAKLKSRASLVRTAQHHTRERSPENADPERTKYNWGTRSTAEVIQRYEAKLPAKVRKNAVHAVEFLVSASPEALAAMGQKGQNYFEAAMDWCVNRMGGAGNLLCWSLHQDELTPHLHIVMMPLKDGKLNAKAYIGGHRDTLREMQTAFAEEVGKPFGLERGKPKTLTKRQHQPVREYYAEVNQVVLEKRRRQAARNIISEDRVARLKSKKGKERDDGQGRD